MPNQPLAKDKKRDYWFVDSRRLIVDDDYNEREEMGDIVGLAAEIEAQGVTTPLKGYKKGENYVVIRGHRRRLALKLLEAKGIVLIVPIILEDKAKANPEQWVLDLITSNDGKSLTPWEQAKVIRRLSNFGWSEKDIVARSGKSEVYVRNLLALSAAPQKLINLVREGRVKATLAMEVIREGKVDELLKIAEEGALPPPNAEPDLFGTEQVVVPPSRQRITRGDLKPNSWKAFKKWSKDIDEGELPAAKAKTFKFLKQMEEGELTEEHFKEFFS